MRFSQPGKPWPFISTAKFVDPPKPEPKVEVEVEYSMGQIRLYCVCPGEREDMDEHGNCVICALPQRVDPMDEDDTKGAR